MTLEQTQSAITAMAAQLDCASFRAPPPVPSTCCGKGCAGCVWQAYFDAVAYWLSDAQAQLEQSRKTTV